MAFNSNDVTTTGIHNPKGSRNLSAATYDKIEQQVDRSDLQRGGETVEAAEQGKKKADGLAQGKADASEAGFNMSYTGADVKAYIILPETARENTLKEAYGGNIVLSNKVNRLGTLNTFSVSTFRDKAPVRSLGNVFPSGHVRGSRTVGGTMVFTVLVAGVMQQFIDAYGDLSDSNAAPRVPYALSDQLPPFDLLLQLNNESGESSSLILFGVELFTDDMTFSVNNLVTEQVVRFKATGYTGLRYEGNSLKKTSRFADSANTESATSTKASDFFRGNDVDPYVKGLRNIYASSLDPFI